MKIIFDLNKKKAWVKMQSFMFKNPEYSKGSVQSSYKDYLGGRLFILKRHDDDRVSRMEATLCLYNYRLDKELRFDSDNSYFEPNN